MKNLHVIRTEMKPIRINLDSAKGHQELSDSLMKQDTPHLDVTNDSE